MIMVPVSHALVQEIIVASGAIDHAAGPITWNGDLYDAGLSSHASVSLMLALEEAFDVEFPDSMLQRRTFATIDAIVAAVTRLQGEMVSS